MSLTVAIQGPSGVGKSPLDPLFRPEVQRLEPYRVREAPLGEHDVYYASQEVRDALRRLCREDRIAASGDVEVFPSVSFFRVRGSDQFLLTPIGLDRGRPLKIEIYAPVLARLLNLPGTGDVLPIGGVDGDDALGRRLLVLTLNPCGRSLRDGLGEDEMKGQVEHAIRCRHRVDSTPGEGPDLEQDVRRRTGSLGEEMAAWRQLTGVELIGWEFLEYTYCARRPVPSPDQVEPIRDERELIAHQKERLKQAQRTLLACVRLEGRSAGEDLAERFEQCLRTETQIDREVVAPAVTC